MPIGDITKGSLISDEEELELEYSERRKPQWKKSIPIDEEVPDGWEVLKKFKKVKHITKDRPLSQLLEDNVWTLLFELGMQQLSSRGFTIVIRDEEGVEKPKQLDVVAIDEKVVFVVECKSRAELGKKSLKKDIAELLIIRSKLQNALQRLLGMTGLKFVYVIATENIEWYENDKVDAQEGGIFRWDEFDLLALHDLTAVAGEGAKYQVYNRVFYGKKIKGFDVSLPALESRMGGYTYYTFVAAPEDLLKVAYVHHRTGASSFLDLSDSYQRMISKTRVRNIEDYISNGGFFPGAIILNFHRVLLKVEPLGKKSHLERLRKYSRPVAITLPQYYGCAWIVDGQHRLYGYADLDQKYSETVPVVAFIREDRSLESQVFVDINRNQKSIEANLLWDLYENLYLNSKEDHELERRAISRIAKHLNSSSASPFESHIAIPKDRNKGNLTLNTVCRMIKSLKLINRDEGLLFHKSYEETVHFAAERISIFFRVLRDELPDEWGMGDEHYVRTNSGFVVLLGILRDMVECNIAQAELDSAPKFAQAAKRFLQPLVSHLSNAEPALIERYRAAGGAGASSREVRLDLTRVMKESETGFRSIWLEKYEESLESEHADEIQLGGVAAILDQDEDVHLEFKGSISLDVDRLLLGDGKLEQKKDLAEAGVLKTIVGFLNTKGGTIVLGIVEMSKYELAEEERLAEYSVVESKIIIGINQEYGKGDWDRYYQRLLNLIKDRIGATVIDEELVLISKKQYQEIDLCVVTVKPAGTKQYLNDDKFYVRRGNQTDLLSASEIDQFWSAQLA